MIDKTKLEKDLHDGKKLKIIFTKADGSEREMLCFIDPTYVGEEYEFKTGLGTDKDAMRRNYDIQHVWDIEKNSWRAFRWDSVKSFEVL